VKRAAAEKALSSGTPFSDVARQLSQSPTAAKGGDLGAVQPADLSEELQAALKDLKPGGTSPAVQTPFGLHYLHLEEIVPAHPRPYEEVKDRLSDMMFREQYKDAITAYIKGLRGRYNVVVNDRLLGPAVGVEKAPAPPAADTPPAPAAAADQPAAPVAQ
jgi:peptidyl-prolyl cis-trans isomerase C